MMRVIMVNVWFEFEQTVVPYSSRPLRLHDLGVASLAGFIEVRSERCVDVELLRLEITCIRMVLLESGFVDNQSAALSARIKWERHTNGENGKYRFGKTLCT
ncbi:hypothetical protein [Paraburkholderia caledonica]|jgi:hypothetical protein|uniref:hypothetical protein n=1 Tax=Paraburkholderia caledonica TaxID=134536 RepID=UPI0038B6CDF2